ncbi:MAG: GIY-YIG nuclease family protein [Methylobacillus sp.]|nr:GIY-YIG nuclease family protein [Methylobacillus sp.]
MAHKDFTDEDDALLADLGVEIEAKKDAARTPREERVIAGFEDIQRFVDEHGRAPQHGEDRDIFERLYAVRLDRLREQGDCRILLASFDHQRLLSGAEPALPDTTADISDDELLAQLGVDAATADDITELRHVRSRAEIQAAEEIANREKCVDFDCFKPLLDEAAIGLKEETWFTKPFGKDASIELGNFFVVGGQIAYVAEMGEDGETKDGRENPRLRVVFDNGTESRLLMNSLARALYRRYDDAPVGRRLIKKEIAHGALFGDTAEPDDIASGTIYVLRSLSNEPFIAEHRELIHKIGVTGGKVETRIANAAQDATYLLASVEVVATYTLHNISRVKLENIFHRLFGAAQIDVTIQDRFGHPVKPREWFLVPLHVIDEAVRRIQDGSITHVSYDPKTARLLG